jgi:hypothetical protein
MKGNSILKYSVISNGMSVLDTDDLQEARDHLEAINDKHYRRRKRGAAITNRKGKILNGPFIQYNQPAIEERKEDKGHGRITIVTSCYSTPLQDLYHRSSTDDFELNQILSSGNNSNFHLYHTLS